MSDGTIVCNLEYKGYKALLKYDNEEDMYFGKVSDIKDFVYFNGRTEEKAKQDFKNAIDTYIKLGGKEK